EIDTDKYQSVIEGAYKIFIENGIRNISMDDICRKMGISKKTMYRFVDNKADLLKKITEYVKDRIQQRISELEKLEMNAIDVLLEMSKVSSIRHIRINPMITFELRKFYPQVFEDYLSAKKILIISAIKTNLEKGINEGLYRQDLNKDIIAHLYFQKIEDFHNFERDQLEDFSYEKVFEVMFENHIRGISNENGIKYFEKQKEKLNFNIHT
ncbi:MAG: TetR/AcrR family transcriptional regulator, partial [Bacteroidales bacterium]|nr:TetR/AcrR family transcriptional regulator [Bacteroidales bacterium]